jgi:hypothetical protein
MIRSFYTVTAMLCLTAAIATAQAQQPTTQKPENPPSAQPARPAQPAQPGEQPAQPAQPAEPSAMSATNKVTYTGCLKPGTASGSWVLENAEVAARPGASAGAVGTSGASKMTFDLNPVASVNLKPHANHKVEVVGMLSPAKAATEAPSASAAGASSAHAAHQQFSVQSLKMVSATCP